MENIKNIRYILLDDQRYEPKFLCENGEWWDIGDLICHISSPHTENYILKQMVFDWVEDMEADGDNKIKSAFFLLTSNLPEFDPMWKEAFDYVFEKGDYFE